jgi:putative phosphoribosyl transferase
MSPPRTCTPKEPIPPPVWDGSVDAVFANRRDAGRRLAEIVTLPDGEEAVVLALPRGGVPVAYEVAASLQAPLDVIVVRKLGVPHRRELAMGALGEAGVVVIDPRIVRECGVRDEEVDEVVIRERHTVEQQLRDYRDGRPPVDVAGRTAIIVDDGLATGATARAACQVARTFGPRRVVIAVPVAPAQTIGELDGSTDEVICLETPEPFFAVGQWYRDFRQVADADVRMLLATSPRQQA